MFINQKLIYDEKINVEFVRYRTGYQLSIDEPDEVQVKQESRKLIGGLLLQMALNTEAFKKKQKQIIEHKPSEQDKINAHLSGFKREESQSDKHNPFSGYEMMDFGSEQSKWKALFLGLLSPYSNKYQDVMLDTLNQAQQEKEVFATQPTKKIKEKGNETSSNENSFSSSSMTDSEMSQTEKWKKEKEAEITKEQETFNKLLQPMKFKFEAMLKSAKTLKKEDSKNKGKHEEKKASKDFSNSRRRGMSQTGYFSNSFKRHDSTTNHSASDSAQSPTSHLRSKKQSILGSIMPKPLAFLAGVKPQNQMPAAAQPEMRRQATVNQSFLPMKRGPFVISKWKKKILVDAIIDGSMSLEAKEYFNQLIGLHQGALSAQKDEDLLNDNNYKLFLKHKIEQFPKRSINPHYKLQLKGAKFLDYNQFDTQVFLNEQAEKNIKRTKSLENLPFKAKNGEYIFPGNKGFARKTKVSYDKLLETKLTHVIRRKSCICTQCGQSKALQEANWKQILMEPLYPFIKSLEEIEYERRMQKQNMPRSQMRKRMDMDHFKKEIMGALALISETPLEYKPTPKVSPKDAKESPRPPAKEIKLQIDTGAISLPKRPSKTSGSLKLEIPHSPMAKRNRNTELSEFSLQKNTPSTPGMRKRPSEMEAEETLRKKTEKLNECIDMLRRNSQMIRGISPFLPAHLLVPSKVNDVKNATKSTIIEEDPNFKLPLFRSVRVRGARTQMCILLRHHDNKHSQHSIKSLIRKDTPRIAPHMDLLTPPDQSKGKRNISMNGGIPSSPGVAFKNRLGGQRLESQIIEDNNDESSNSDCTSNATSLYTEIEEDELQLMEEKELKYLQDLQKDSQTFYQVRQMIKKAYNIDIERDIQKCRELIVKNKEKLKKAHEKQNSQSRRMAPVHSVPIMETVKHARKGQHSRNSNIEKASTATHHNRPGSQAYEIYLANSTKQTAGSGTTGRRRIIMSPKASLFPANRKNGGRMSQQMSRASPMRGVDLIPSPKGNQAGIFSRVQSPQNQIPVQIVSGLNEFSTTNASTHPKMFKTTKRLSQPNAQVQQQPPKISRNTVKLSTKKKPIPVCQPFTKTFMGIDLTKRKAQYRSRNYGTVVSTPSANVYRTLQPDDLRKLPDIQSKRGL